MFSSSCLVSSPHDWKNCPEKFLRSATVVCASTAHVNREEGGYFHQMKSSKN